MGYSLVNLSDGIKFKQPEHSEPPQEPKSYSLAELIQKLHREGTTIENIAET